MIHASHTRGEALKKKPKNQPSEIKKVTKTGGGGERKNTFLKLQRNTRAGRQPARGSASRRNRRGKEKTETHRLKQSGFQRRPRACWGGAAPPGPAGGTSRPRASTGQRRGAGHGLARRSGPRCGQGRAGPGQAAPAAASPSPPAARSRCPPGGEAPPAQPTPPVPPCPPRPWRPRPGQHHGNRAAPRAGPAWKPRPRDCVPGCGWGTRHRGDTGTARGHRHCQGSLLRH